MNPERASLAALRQTLEESDEFLGELSSRLAKNRLLARLLIRSQMREWARRRRRAVAKHDDSDDMDFGQVLGTLSLARLCEILGQGDLDRLDARMRRVMDATVTRAPAARTSRPSQARPA
jgi:hypothetical protein